MSSVNICVVKCGLLCVKLSFFQGFNRVGVAAFHNTADVSLTFLGTEPEYLLMGNPRRDININQIAGEVLGVFKAVKRYTTVDDLRKVRDIDA